MITEHYVLTLYIYELFKQNIAVSCQISCIGLSIVMNNVPENIKHTQQFYRLRGRVQRLPFRSWLILIILNKTAGTNF